MGFSGSIALDGTPKRLLEALTVLPEGMRVVLDIRVFCSSPWNFRLSDDGTPIPGPEGLWFTLYGVNIHQWALFSSPGTPTLYFMVNGK